MYIKINLYLDIHVAAFQNEATQIRFFFKQRGYSAQADIAFKILQIGEESKCAQCGDTLVRVQGASARKANLQPTKESGFTSV